MDTSCRATWTRPARSFRSRRSPTRTSSRSRIRLSTPTSSSRAAASASMAFRSPSLAYTMPAGRRFSLAIIPHTWQKTTAGTWHTGQSRQPRVRPRRQVRAPRVGASGRNGRPVARQTVSACQAGPDGTSGPLRVPPTRFLGKGPRPGPSVRAKRQTGGCGTENARHLARHCPPIAMSALSAARLNPTSVLLRLGFLSAAVMSLVLF